MYNTSLVNQLIIKLAVRIRQVNRGTFPWRSSGVLVFVKKTLLQPHFFWRLQGKILFEKVSFIFVKRRVLNGCGAWEVSRRGKKCQFCRVKIMYTERVLFYSPFCRWTNVFFLEWMLSQILTKATQFVQGILRYYQPKG